METPQQIKDGRSSVDEALEIPDELVQEDVGKLKRPLKPLSKRKVASYNEGLKKRGVVYISRVPPFMKPAKVKHLMEQHGVVTRVSLVVIACRA